MAPNSFLTEEILNSLMGGTLIEYVDGEGLQREWGRVTITAVSVIGGSVNIDTDGRACWGCAFYPEASCYLVDGVYYVFPPYLHYWYALAPKGVAIPTPRERAWRDLREVA